VGCVLIAGIMMEKQVTINNENCPGCCIRQLALNEYENNKNTCDLIIDLIHQRSIAFDYGREQSEKLAIAIKALEKYSKTKIGATAAKALITIKEMNHGK
jgi:hypothetical protein